MLGRAPHWGISARTSHERILADLRRLFSQLYESKLLLESDGCVDSHDAVAVHRVDLSALLLKRWRARCVLRVDSPLLSIDGNQIGDVVREASALRDHWAPRFQSDYALDLDAVSSLLPPVSLPPMPPLSPSSEDFVEILRSAPKTSPGPNRIPYSLLVCIASLVGDILVDAVASYSSGLGLPSTWFWCLLVFIPKRSDVSLSPGDLRPIALEQVQLKLIHRWLASLLQVWARRVVHASQFGFLLGRRMSDCLASAELSVWQCAGFRDDAAILSLDLVNAFGSISRAWLRHVLVSYGASTDWLHVFDAWLSPGSCKILWKHQIFEGFIVSSGVPQGDPLSAVVFVIALDPFCRHLAMRLPSPCCIIAFADDLLLVMDSLGRAVVISAALLLLKGASGLSVTNCKSAWLPLTLFDLPSFSALLTVIFLMFLLSVGCGGLVGGFLTIRMVLPNLRGRRSWFAPRLSGISWAAWLSRPSLFLPSLTLLLLTVFVLPLLVKMTGGLGVLLLVPSLVGSRPGVKFCWTGEPRLLGGLPTCDLLMNVLYIGVSMPYRLLVLMWLLGWPVSGLLVGVRPVVFPPRLIGGFGMVVGLTGLSALFWSLKWV